MLIYHLSIQTTTQKIMAKFWEESNDLYTLCMSTPSMYGFLRDVAGVIHWLEVSWGENVAPSLII